MPYYLIKKRRKDGLRRVSVLRITRQMPDIRMTRKPAENYLGIL
jgi:hypothetical protein